MAVVDVWLVSAFLWPVCGSVFKIRFADRVIKEGRMSDEYMPRNEGTSFSATVSGRVHYQKSAENCDVYIFEVKQTRVSFGKWLVKLMLRSYIVLVGERNMTPRRRGRV